MVGQADAFDQIEITDTMIEAGVASSRGDSSDCSSASAMIWPWISSISGLVPMADQPASPGCLIP